MRSSETKKRNMIIGSLLGVLLLMVVGYAAFSSVLNISGTSGISSNWKILITNIEEKNIVGGASTAINEETKKPEITGIGTLTATFKTNLVSPGDSIEYDITVTNQGSIDAKLDKITPESLSIKDGAIIFTRSAVGFEVGDVLKAGESKVLTVKVEYDESVTSQPESTKGTFTVTLDYSQNGGGSDTPVLGETAAEKLIATEVTSGDGLYADEYETGRYIYKGGNPNNYITFNGEPWKIISVESDGKIKLIKTSSIGTIAWDTSGAGNWGNSTLNTYLTGTYYNNLNENAQSQTNEGVFNLGSVNPNTSDIPGAVTKEKTKTTISRIALPTISEYFRANSNSSTCTEIKYDCTSSAATQNWLAGILKQSWLLTPFSEPVEIVDYVISDGTSVYYMSGLEELNVHPVLYLKSNITLSGEGTSDKPYTINS